MIEGRCNFKWKTGFGLSHAFLENDDPGKEAGVPYYTYVSFKWGMPVMQTQ